MVGAAHGHPGVFWTRALLSTYIAKKRAEIAPTVGRLNTDLFFVSQCGYASVSHEMHERMRDIYEAMEGRIAFETEAARADAHAVLMEIATRPPPQPQPQQPSPPPPSEAAPAPDFSDLAMPIEEKKKPKKRKRKKPPA